MASVEPTPGIDAMPPDDRTGDMTIHEITPDGRQIITRAIAMTREILVVHTPFKATCRFVQVPHKLKMRWCVDRLCCCLNWATELFPDDPVWKCDRCALEETRRQLFSRGLPVPLPIRYPLESAICW
jgi:hypothetical protein